MKEPTKKQVVFGYWKDRVPHKFWAGRNASLLHVRSWGLVIGRHFFSFELKGWGPTP